LDYAEAVKWFRKAAEQGNAGAQNNLGSCYQNGHGVTNDYVEALKWYRKAAEQGLGTAQVNLGSMYRDGKGVETNYTEAAKWLRKAAEQGDIDERIKINLQMELGRMYQIGLGVPQDDTESVKWYRKAAEQGDADAQARLGGMYEDGKGVTQDYVEAAKWYRRAAEQGDILAQSILGNFYSYGTGVPKNNIEAYMWWNLVSAHSGNNEIEKKLIESCASLRDLMVKIGEITPEEIAEAQQQSAAFVPRKETPSSSSDNSVSSNNPRFSGTGFFITDDGYLISNYHVVKEATKVRLVTSAGLIDAKVVQVDAANDLALLKADGRFAPLPIISSRTVKLGGTVATVGFPDIGLQGFAPKFARGEIASLSGASDDARYFQISMPVQPGNSGGALVDEHGNVVGVVSAKLNASAALAASGALPENVNYAVKSSFLLSFLESVPAVSDKLKAPVTDDKKFSDVVKSAQDAAVLVLVY
jgi:TPR repeat protein